MKKIKQDNLNVILSGTFSKQKEDQADGIHLNLPRDNNSRFRKFTMLLSMLFRYKYAVLLGIKAIYEYRIERCFILTHSP